MSDAALNAGYRAFGDSFTEQLEARADEKWRTAGRKTKAKPNGEDVDWWAENGLNMVKAYHDWRIANPNMVIWDTPQGVPAVELEILVDAGNGTMVKGSVDRVFQDFNSGELCIVDLKTGSNTPTPIQLASYKLALYKTFGITIKFGAYWMAREGRLVEVHDLDRYTPDMIARWFRNVRKAIDMGLFTPHASRDCGWCGMKEHCYVWNDNTITPDFNDDMAQEGK